MGKQSAISARPGTAIIVDDLTMTITHNDTLHRTVRVTDPATDKVRVLRYPFGHFFTTP